MDTLLASSDAEMHRILFSADPPLGDLPVFEHVEDPPPDDVETQPLMALEPDIRAFEALYNAGGGDHVLVQHVLRTGTNPRDLQACLTRAAQSGQEHLVQTLLSAGVPPSLGAVKAAIVKESIVMLALFLKHGWSINEEEAWCIPPLLSFAIYQNVSASLVAWLLDNGADPNATCQMDITPLSTAVAGARYPVVEQLFNHCPSPTVFRGQLLHFAAGRHEPENYDRILRLVLHRCPNEINVLMYEDHCFSYEVRKVVGLGTALHEAARIGRLSGVQILIANGAHTCIRNSDGKTALEVAEREQNTAVANELRSHGENYIECPPEAPECPL